MNGKNLSGISTKEFRARQQVLDVEKWLASERAGQDLCGTFPFCAYCVKTESDPCARAELREKMRQALDDLSEIAVTEEPAVTEAPNEGTEKAVESAEEEEMLEDSLALQTLKKEPPEGYESVLRYRRTFRSKLIQSGGAQDLYTELKNTFSGYAGIRSRVTQSGENFRVGGRKIAKIAIGGKTLCLYLALDPKAFEDSKYRFKDVSDKKTYSETPMKVRVTGSRSLKHAKELIGYLAEKFDLPNVGYISIDYRCPYKTDEELVRMGLIRLYTAFVKKKK